MFICQDILQKKQRYCKTGGCTWTQQYKHDKNIYDINRKRASEMYGCHRIDTLNVKKNFCEPFRNKAVKKL